MLKEIQEAFHGSEGNGLVLADHVDPAHSTWAFGAYIS